MIKELSILDSESRHSRLAALVSELEQRSSSPSPRSSAFLESDEPHVGLSVSYGGSVEYNIDENGRVSIRYSTNDEYQMANYQKQQYFGATSRFHTLSEDNEHPAHALDTTTEREYSEIEDYHRKWHLSNSRWQATWENQAHENIPKYTDVDASLCSRLLDVYWTWQGPLHQYVYRRCAHLISLLYRRHITNIHYRLFPRYGHRWPILLLVFVKRHVRSCHATHARGRSTI